MLWREAGALSLRIGEHLGGRVGAKPWYRCLQVCRTAASVKPPMVGRTAASFFFHLSTFLPHNGRDLTKTGS